MTRSGPAISLCLVGRPKLWLPRSKARPPERVFCSRSRNRSFALGHCTWIPSRARPVLRTSTSPASALDAGTDYQSSRSRPT